MCCNFSKSNVTLAAAAPLLSRGCTLDDEDEAGSMPLSEGGSTTSAERLMLARLQTATFGMGEGRGGVLGGQLDKKTESKTLLTIS